MPLPPIRNKPKNAKAKPKPNPTPLESLLFLGISRSRAEKALTWTNGDSAKKAMNWLVSHALHDRHLDDGNLREYALYVVPIGPFGDQLVSYWNVSRELCSWNVAHNRLPHMTLIKFFQAPANVVPHLIAAVDETLEKVQAYKDEPLLFTRIMDDDFIGFHLHPEYEAYFRQIAETYIDMIEEGDSEKEASTSRKAKFCFPASNQRKLLLLPQGSLDEPHQCLHITLAYRFPEQDSVQLHGMMDRMQLFEPNSFELRLYSRVISDDTCQMFRVSHPYKNLLDDEIPLNKDEFVMASREAMEYGEESGWVHGYSMASGVTGFFPLNHTIRVPESDSWCLHKTVHIIGSGRIANPPAPNQNIYIVRNPEEISFEEHSRGTIENQNFCHLWKPTLGKLVQSPNVSQKLMIMRHGERVDHVFPNWTDHCFLDNDGDQYCRLDLNMPAFLPLRADGNLISVWKLDPPLTNIGLHSAFMTGQMFRETGTGIQFIYCSPALRCIQTAQAVLEGMQAVKDVVKIRIEPALFEWGHYHTKIPRFMSQDELIEARYNIDMTYLPAMSNSELRRRARYEKYEAYYKRNERFSEYVTRMYMDNILIVAHAPNLETNSRQLLRKRQLERAQLEELMKKIPNTSLLTLEKNERLEEWFVANPIILPLTHSRNYQFDTRLFEPAPPLF